MLAPLQRYVGQRRPQILLAAQPWRDALEKTTVSPLLDP